MIAQSILNQYDRINEDFNLIGFIDRLMLYRLPHLKEHLPLKDHS